MNNVDILGPSDRRRVQSGQEKAALLAEVDAEGGKVRLVARRHNTDYVPGHFRVIRHLRPKCVCQACDVITQAPAPAMPTPRGRATPATLAHLLVPKYCDHLPLYRQCEIYAREAWSLRALTLWDWVGQAAWLLAPVVAAIRAHVFAGEKIDGDDTTVPVLAPRLGRTTAPPIEHGIDHCGVLRVCVDVTDERTVNLQARNRISFQQCQRRSNFRPVRRSKSSRPLMLCETS